MADSRAEFTREGGCDEDRLTARDASDCVAGCPRLQWPCVDAIVEEAGGVANLELYGAVAEHHVVALLPCGNRNSRYGPQLGKQPFREGSRSVPARNERGRDHHVRAFAGQQSRDQRAL